MWHHPRMGRPRGTAVAVAVAVGLLLAGACSSDSGGDDDAAATTTTTPAGGETTVTSDATTTTRPRPDGPAAEISDELAGGAGVNIASPTPAAPVLAAASYEEHEFAAAGTASSYVAQGELGFDGRWTFTEGDTAPYRTRVLVRRPADPAAFNGTVVVEWLNVSGGLDADPDWQSLHEEITRAGAIWVGVSAQLIGVNGGPVAVSTPQSEAAGAGRGIRTIDPERYGALDHPGDGFSFDIFTQVARAVRAGGPLLGGAIPEQIVALGESQSAFALVTYINGVQPLTHAFDGFLVHSRGATGLPLSAPGEGAGIADAIGGTPAILREDTTVPVLELQSETDVTGILSSYASRQDDSEVFRLWEVAGTAHADRHLVGEANADALGCGAINDGPLHLVAKAALRALDQWIRTGGAPPTADRLEVTTDPAPAIARDVDGIALGGVRTPLVDAPVDVLSGEPGPSPSIVCLLSGSTTPLSTEALVHRYPTREVYDEAFAALTEDVIHDGFVLEDDRGALLAYADRDRVPE